MPATELSSTTTLHARVRALTAERLGQLRELGFDALSQLQPDEVELRGRWGRKATVRTEVLRLDENTVRVAVLSWVTAWWSPAYAHSIAGFRVGRDGSYQELTQADFYDLD